MKKIFILLMMLPVFAIAQKPEDLVHSNRHYVDDYDGIFTADQVNSLDKTIRHFFDTAQISIVTINTFAGISPSDYATRLGRSWGVGGLSNTGLLIIICAESRHIEVATGYGLEGDLPDVTVVELQKQYAVPRFKEGKYYEGIRGLLDAYINRLSPSAKALRQKEQEAQKVKNQIAFDKAKTIFFIILIILGVGAIIYLPIYRRRKRKLEEEKKAYQQWEEREEEYINPAIPLAAALASSHIPIPKVEEKEKEDDDSYSSPSYNNDNDSSYSSGSSDDSSSSSSSDFGGGSFGGGGGGSDW